jgi:hypothetical protein
MSGSKVRLAAAPIPCNSNCNNTDFIQRLILIRLGMWTLNDAHVPYRGKGVSTEKVILMLRLDELLVAEQRLFCGVRRLLMGPGPRWASIEASLWPAHDRVTEHGGPCFVSARARWADRSLLGPQQQEPGSKPRSDAKLPAGGGQMAGSPAMPFRAVIVHLELVLARPRASDPSLIR